MRYKNVDYIILIATKSSCSQFLGFHVEQCLENIILYMGWFSEIEFVTNIY